jgi:uncharacterized protein with HEPN domain
VLVADILDRIERIESYVAGMHRDAFLDDTKASDAVVRCLEVIGEAANRLPAEFVATYDDVPWRRIVGLRTRIVHEYFDVDLPLVWHIVGSELPLLKSRLKEVSQLLPEDVGE